MLAAILNMFGMEGGWSWLLWIVFMVVFFLFYPRLMTAQIIWKLEKAAKQLEDMSDSTGNFLAKEVAGGRPSAKIKNSVSRFLEFFVIEPVSLDPYGIVKKFDHLIQEQKGRFKYFVDQAAPKAGEEKKAELMMGLSGGISMHQIAKIVRHYVELVRKTKSVQIAMIIQMQLPLIERIAKAIYRGTRALAKGHPIGDGIGPLFISGLMKGKTKEVEEDIISSKTKIGKKNVVLLKAKGPGGRIGRPGKAVEKFVKKRKVSRIITVDASAKLEGEKTGTIAEGVGVAMGGPGVERSYIEEVAVKKKIPLDSIVVKMSQEEAITPMKKDIKDAVPVVMESVKRSLKRVKPKTTALIVGVGNTSGVGNSKKASKKTIKWVDKFHKAKKRKKKKKEKKFFL